MYRMEVECMSIIYDTNWFINRIKEKRPNDYDDYVVLGVYKDSHTPIKMYHKVCKKKFDITPNSFLSGRGCNKCGSRRAGKKMQISLQEAYNRIPDSYIILDEFESVLKRNLMYCEDCGRVFYARVHDLERRPESICQYCNFSNKNKDDDEFKWQVSILVGTDYTFLDKYKDARTSLEVIHNACNHKYHVTPHNFLRGKRCPRCKESHGEAYITDLLERHNIKYIRQKTFDGCVYKHKLLFDFYLPDYNLCIEYDGEQHYHPVKHLGGKKNYDIGHKRDLVKDQFCKDNGIKLLRIPYTVSFDNIYSLIKSYMV